MQYYNVFGQKIGSHFLAMGVLATMAGGTTLALSGGGKKTATQAPPINAASSDEADFIKKFMEEAEAEEKKTKH